MKRRLKRLPGTVILFAVMTVMLVIEIATNAFTDETAIRKLGAITDDLFLTREYGRLIKAIFLHGNVVHWLGNSWILLQAGRLFEEMFGTRRFLLVWFATGIVASAASSLTLPEGSVGIGASGALMGVLGAFVFTIRQSPYWRNHPIASGLRIQLLIYTVWTIGLGFMTPFTDNTAHVAGFLCGLVMGLMRHGSRQPAPAPELSART